MQLFPQPTTIFGFRSEQSIQDVIALLLVRMTANESFLHSTEAQETTLSRLFQGHAKNDARCFFA